MSVSVCAAKSYAVLAAVTLACVFGRYSSGGICAVLYSSALAIVFFVPAFTSDDYSASTKREINSVCYYIVPGKLILAAFSLYLAVFDRSCL